MIFFAPDFFFSQALNSEIKAKRETLESVLKDNEACVNSIRVRRCLKSNQATCKSRLLLVFQDYETDLASYTSGLETLLNIPVKRTMIRSPSTDLNQEVLKCEDDGQVSLQMFLLNVALFFLFTLQATQLQTRYMELLTLSGDYYRYLGDLLKKMEQLKVFLYFYFCLGCV